MKKIVIIGVYFGEFPEHFNLWLKSCSYNPTIDFKIFTDQEINTNYNNIKFYKMTLSNMKELASKKLKIINLSLDRPYKCCDFKPVYGVIFEDYIKEYDFWGHCDFDLIFGNIRKFITDDILDNYDKILPLGHLAIYKNNKVVNYRYKEEGSITGNYYEVFTNDKSYAFDETNGINEIYEHNNYPLYKERIFADISTVCKRFKNALKDKNYNYQVFYWENGSVYRAYFANKKILKDEFIYIHFQKRKNMRNSIENVDKCNSFYICDDGFIEKEKGLPKLEEIQKYNHFKSSLYERLELKKFKIKKFINKLERIINQK